MEDLIRNEILQGLLQVDSSFFITYFSMSFDPLTRHTKVSFKAQNADGEEVEGVKIYA